jgi:hypothetical protein
LVDIAKNAKYSIVCLAAVEKIDDQQALADIAKNSKYTDVREAANKKLQCV